MKGHPEVLKNLNKILYNELVAINQYFLHSKMFKDWGLTELAEHEYSESIDEMRHADALVERILKRRGAVLVYDYDDALFIKKASHFNPVATFLRSPGKVRQLFRLVD